MFPQDENVYKTKDLYEASYLYSQGVHFVGIEPNNSHYLFVFQNTKLNCTHLSQKFWSGKAIGSIKRFIDSYKTLKDLIFSQNSKRYEN